MPRELPDADSGERLRRSPVRSGSGRNRGPVDGRAAGAQDPGRLGDLAAIGDQLAGAAALLPAERAGSAPVIARGLDGAFQDQVRDLVKPGTSALFMMLEKVTPDQAVEAMSKSGGSVLKTSLSKDAEQNSRKPCPGTGDPAASNR
jgi:Protein of unknown function (DUF1269)